MGRSLQSDGYDKWLKLKLTTSLDFKYLTKGDVMETQRTHGQLLNLKGIPTSIDPWPAVRYPIHRLIELVRHGFQKFFKLEIAPDIIRKMLKNH